MLRQVLEESHPGLYRYTPKPQMDSAFEAALNSVGRPMGEREFYGIVSAFLSHVKDGHTRVYLTNDYRKFLNGTAKRLPLRVRLLGRRVIVLRSPDAAVPPGSQVLAIDGKPISLILRTLVDHLSGDGDILTGKYAAISDNFSAYYYLFVAQPDSFHLRYRTPRGQERTRTLAAAPPSELKALEDVDDSQPPLRYEPLGIPHAGRLVIETFALPPADKGGQDFAQFLASTFRQIKSADVEDLVVDLRGNDGGADLGPLLFSYMTDHEFQFCDSAEAVSRSFPLLHQYSHLDATFAAEFEDHLLPLPDGRYRLEGNPDLVPPPQSPQAEPYLGRVWFLVDGSVFSATAQFCSVARSHHRGAFVGEETGGAYHGNSSGEEVVITLPASRLRVVVPLLRYEMAHSDHSAARRGIIPNYPFQPRARDLLDNRDAELAYVLDLIEKQRRTRSRSRP